jgi:hypothetical protein
MKMADKEWTEKDGIIRFSVEVNGIEGAVLYHRLERCGCIVSDYAKSILLNVFRSEDIHLVKSVTIKIAVLKGELFTDKGRITKNIRVEAERCNLQTPSAEIACRIREKFSNEDLEAMGLWWIIAMHEPIKNSSGGPGMLCVGGRYHVSLDAFVNHLGYEWHRKDGFAFVDPEV